ncbi:MAG: hypothetical protein RL380_1534 [Verrucomicrobiota bacterium]|jgi:hypothetical protein
MKLKNRRRPVRRPLSRVMEPTSLSGAWLLRYGGIFSVTSPRRRASRLSVTRNN